MSKFDFSKTIKRVQDSYKKSSNETMATKVGLGSSLENVSTDPLDYVVMPEWFKNNYGILGLKFGHMVQWAGTPDSGKTSFSIEAMRAAQEQGYGVIYVETEGKTGPEDLEAAGIDPNGVMCAHSAITEEAFELGLKLWESFFVDHPKEKLLFVFDSFGNTTSTRDAGSDLTEKSQLVGGHAKVNRFGLSIMKAKMNTDPVAVLLVNRTYSNIGSVGKTNAGGDALNYFVMLTIQSTRAAWYEKTVDKQKVRAGADVQWNVYKNHYAKALRDEEGNQVLLPKSAKFRISADGIQPLQASNE